MNYRFYLTILSSRVEVFPLNFLKTSLVDKNGGEVFYRRTFNGTLRFYCNTKTGTTDFELLYLIETVDNCTDLILEIEQKNSAANTYHNYWTGHFSTVDGSWDLDNSTFDVTPKPYDYYYPYDIDGKIQYNIIAGVPAKVTCNTAEKPEDYKRCMFVVDVLEYLVQQVFGAATTVTSWFLNNANNPVIGGVNKWRYLTILQKSDAKRPDATNPATKGMLSLDELMYILRVMYNLRWTYDGTTVRIEHLSYWDSFAGLDLSLQTISQRQNKYTYLKSDMPRFEKFNFMEADDNNYTEHIISYDENCTVSEGNADYQINVTTDIEYIEAAVSDQQLSPNEGLINNISDDGWVILSNELTGGVYNVYYGAAYESGDASYNYCNSWSYLLRAFHLHNRVLMSGWINSTAVDFISARKIIKQEIKAIVCYEDDYSPEDYITTELGEDYLSGKKGYVDGATIHPDGHVEFTLLYGEDSDDAVVMPPTPKSINIVYHTTAPLDVCTYLSEPNIYDTFFSIRLNGTDCTEITILAGTVYQCDLLLDPGAPVASYEFNIEDDSLNGWSVFVNGGMIYTRIDNTSGCPAVPPAPPAVPVPPVLGAPSQGDMCDPIAVNWSVSAGATYYKIFRNPDKFMNPSYGLLTTSVPNAYNDYAGGLEHGTTFYYKIQACNISGCSADSNEENSGVIWCPHG